MYKPGLESSRGKEKSSPWENSGVKLFYFITNSRNKYIFIGMVPCQLFEFILSLSFISFLMSSVFSFVIASGFFFSLSEVCFCLHHTSRGFIAD